MKNYFHDVVTKTEIRIETAVQVTISFKFIIKTELLKKALLGPKQGVYKIY